MIKYTRYDARTNVCNAPYGLDTITNIWTCMGCSKNILDSIHKVMIDINMYGYTHEVDHDEWSHLVEIMEP